jgi:hypothetical protein
MDLAGLWFHHHVFQHGAKPEKVICAHINQGGDVTLSAHTDCTPAVRMAGCTLPFRALAAEDCLILMQLGASIHT